VAASPAYQFYGSDFDSATGAYALDEVGAYVRLMNHQWSNGNVPDGDSPEGLLRVARIMRVPPAKARNLWVVVGDKFPLNGDGKRRNPRMEAVRQKQQDFIARQTAASHAAAEKRRKPPADTSTDASVDDPAGTSTGHPARGSSLLLRSGSVVPSSPAGLSTEGGSAQASDGGLSPALCASVAEMGFDAFWKAYPVKVGKGKARSAWKRSAKRRPTLATLLERLALLKKSGGWQEENGRFIPHPTTWLNRGGWEDEPQPARGKANGRPRGTGAEVDAQLAEWAREER
jgi:uncharacterized protein YdaU (DUF1376 family)